MKLPLEWLHVYCAPDLDPEFVQWVYRTLRKHDAAWRELADQ